MQTGVLYGLWGCAITAFGFAFGGVVDFLGENAQFYRSPGRLSSLHEAYAQPTVMQLLQG